MNCSNASLAMLSHVIVIGAFVFMSKSWLDG